MPDRAENDFAIMRCRALVVPLRNVNKKFKRVISGSAQPHAARRRRRVAGCRSRATGVLHRRPLRPRSVSHLAQLDPESACGVPSATRIQSSNSCSL
jgi:hypothetical protein